MKLDIATTALLSQMAASELPRLTIKSTPFHPLDRDCPGWLRHSLWQDVEIGNPLKMFVGQFEVTSAE